MALTREQVQHVALLARLELTEAEIQRDMHELNQILPHLDQLNQLDTAGIEPTSHAIPMTNVLRDDVVQPSLPNQAALANAPDQDAGCFRVPRVVEG